MHPTVEIVARDRSGLYADGAATGAPQARQVADRFDLFLNLSAAIERVLEERSRELILPGAAEPRGAEQEVSPAPTGRRKKVAELADYLDERWKEGCHNSAQLFKEIRTRGYKGSRQMVSAFVSSWRPPGGRQRAATAPQRVAPKHASILAAQPTDKLTPEQNTLFDRLAERCPDLVQLRSMALAFREVFSSADSAALLRWIQDTKRCCFGPLVRFAYGLQNDIKAVSAAVETDSSNGQTEGQINRLKTIKRQMYGRAGFAYLRARVLPSPVLIPPAVPRPP